MANVLVFAETRGTGLRKVAFEAVTAVGTALVAPGGKRFGGKILFTSRGHENISRKQTTRMMIDFRSMKISANVHTAIRPDF